MTARNTFMTQVPTPKLHVNLTHNHHQCKLTPLQRLRTTFLQLKVFPKRNLTLLEAENTIYAPIPILITQKYTDIDVCKILFSAPFLRVIIIFHFIFCAHSTHFFSFSFLGAYTKLPRTTTKLKNNQ